MRELENIYRGNNKQKKNNNSFANFDLRASELAKEFDNL